MSGEEQLTEKQRGAATPAKQKRARYWIAPLSAVVGAAVAVGSIAAYQRSWFAFGRSHVEMVSIPAGEFKMGSAQGDPDEAPEHSVRLKGFRIGKTEVTVSAYQACVKAEACAPAFTNFIDCNANKPGREHNPVNCVNYAMADTYCKWRKSRLPSEAEWEFAARGKEGRLYPWGSELPLNRACYLRRRDNLPSCPVGSFPSDRSTFGVMDLGGNVSEWTGSGYCSYEEPTKCKPGTRAVRGGSWDMEIPLMVRGSYRDWVLDERYGYNLGFRCAQDE